MWKNDAPLCSAGRVAKTGTDVNLAAHTTKTGQHISPANAWNWNSGNNNCNHDINTIGHFFLDSCKLSVAPVCFGPVNRPLRF